MSRRAVLARWARVAAFVLSLLLAEAMALPLLGWEQFNPIPMFS